MIYKFNEHDFMKIRKNIDESYIPNNIYDYWIRYFLYKSK